MENEPTNEHVNSARNRLSHEEYHTVCQMLESLACNKLMVLSAEDVIAQVLHTLQIIISKRQLANMLMVCRIRHRDGLTDTAQMQLEIDSLREDIERMAVEIALLMKERTAWKPKDKEPDPF